MRKGCNALGAVGDWKYPAATQAQFVTQDTPVSVVNEVPALGVAGAIAQDVPFQSIASVAGEGPDAACVCPTAVHVVALKQETPVSSCPYEIDVSGVGVIDQAEPFQVSAKFWLVESTARPTAEQ